MDMHMQFRYLHVYVSLRRAAKAQTSMCIPLVSQNLHFLHIQIMKAQTKTQTTRPAAYIRMSVWGRLSCADPGRQWSRPPPPPLKNHTNIGYFNNTGPDPLKKSQSYQSYKASIQFWTISARHFRWRADDGPLIVVFVWILSPFKKNVNVNLNRLKTGNPDKQSRPRQIKCSILQRIIYYIWYNCI